MSVEPLVLSKGDHMQVWQQMIVGDVCPHLHLTSSILHLRISGLFAELKMADHCNHIVELELSCLVIVELEQALLGPLLSLWCEPLSTVGYGHTKECAPLACIPLV